jgi:hypothetical protein
MTRRTSHTEPDIQLPTAQADTPMAPAALRVHGAPSSALAQRRHGPRTRQEVEQRYVAARETWVAAMRAANSGRPADLAALAIAQEAYEAAAAERTRWESSGRVAIPVEPEPEQKLGAVVGQEVAWRQVRHIDDKPTGILGRLRRRMRGGQD